MGNLLIYTMKFVSKLLYYKYISSNRNKKHPLFSFLASGSWALMAMTFQSISPSSIMAKMPNTFTWMT